MLVELSSTASMSREVRSASAICWSTLACLQVTILAEISFRKLGLVVRVHELPPDSRRCSNQVFGFRCLALEFREVLEGRTGQEHTPYIGLETS